MVHEIKDSNILKKLLALIKGTGYKTLAAYALLLLLVLTALITFFLTKERQTVQQQAAPQQQNPNRITYLGKDWYLHGANVPWYNWSCDFGCNQNGGALENIAVFRAGFQKMKDANMHVARWWVFPGSPWQINRDSNNMPQGLNPSIYADFDAALMLAEEFDIYYNFVLFSSATHVPSSWLTDASQRSKLAEVLGVLFARYKDNPRIMSWEIFNEPEFQIWNDDVAQQPVVDTVKAISDSVHANSGALTTVGGAMLDGISMWKNTGIDYYSPHWYDYMQSGGWCARCTNYNKVRNRFGINNPVVIGELYIGSDTDALVRFNDFYNKGYAGAWPWSLFPERTDDKLGIDFNAAGQFSQDKNDLGPVSQFATPSPTHTPTQPTITNIQNTPTSVPIPTNTPTLTLTPTHIPSPIPPTSIPTATTTLAPTKTPAQKADFNNSGTVDIQDLSYLLSNWGTGNGSADLNNDGTISIFDLSILLSNYGK